MSWYRQFSLFKCPKHTRFVLTEGLSHYTAEEKNFVKTLQKTRPLSPVGQSETRRGLRGRAVVTSESAHVDVVHAFPLGVVTMQQQVVSQ